MWRRHLPINPLELQIAGVELLGPYPRRDKDRATSRGLQEMRWSMGERAFPDRPVYRPIDFPKTECKRSASRWGLWVCPLTAAFMMILCCLALASCATAKDDISARRDRAAQKLTEEKVWSRQIGLVRDLLAAGVPSFGSCFAIQLAAVALGGRCGASPNGREFGIARKIRLNAEGRAHPLYRDKPEVFDAFTSHADEVVELPPETSVLASNDWSDVQGASAGDFWAVQYHPEYDLHEVASLCRLRKQELVAQGTFSKDEEADRYIESLEALHADPSRDDLATALDVGESLLDEEIRTLEVRNWTLERLR